MNVCIPCPQDGPGQNRDKKDNSDKTRTSYPGQDIKRKVQHGHTVITDANYTVDHSTDRTVLLYLKRIDGFSKEYV